jgi:hypothetical protein
MISCEKSEMAGGLRVGGGVLPLFSRVRTLMSMYTYEKGWRTPPDTRKPPFRKGGSPSFSLKWFGSFLMRNFTGSVGSWKKEGHPPFLWGCLEAGSGGISSSPTGLVGDLGRWPRQWWQSLSVPDGDQRRRDEAALVTCLEGCLSYSGDGLAAWTRRCVSPHLRQHTTPASRFLTSWDFPLIPRRNGSGPQLLRIGATQLQDFSEICDDHGPRFRSQILGLTTAAVRDLGLSEICDDHGPRFLVQESDLDHGGGVGAETCARVGVDL